jgi:outer membrane immunogenic protein
MKRLIATSVALAGMTGSALGADLGPPVELPWTWAGPYLGLHAGFGLSNDEAKFRTDCNKSVNHEDEDKDHNHNGGTKIKTASAGPDGASGAGFFIVDGKIVQSSEAEAGPDGAEATADNGGDGHFNEHQSDDHSGGSADCHTDVPSNHLAMADSDGFIGGGQIGYNFQFSQWVMGIEGDISFTDWDGTDALGTVRGRLGYAWERVMPYVTGGLAIADADTGWTAGGGIELAVSNNVSVRGEYLHFDLSAIDGDIVRAGVNFRFWRPQPQPVLSGY